MTKRYRVGILGATGAVGQRFVQLLEGHPLFEVTRLYASERSAGKTYTQATDWRIPAQMPAAFADMPVTIADPTDDVDLVFSALHKTQAAELEPAFAAAGKAVISNASTYRMGEDIPLLIPEINADHLQLIDVQRKNRNWSGYIVTNPNCATIGLALALKPLHDAFGIEQVQVVTLQARSGAGYPGPPDEVIKDNALPYISNEEDKLETEPNKILGLFSNGKIDHAPIATSASCHRVDVMDGHLKAASLRFKKKPHDIDEIHAALRAFNEESAKLQLHSQPSETIVIHTAEDRPQPKLDRHTGDGMSVHVGRVRACPVLDYKMSVLSHNTIRGAAGAALLNAELLAAKNLI